MTDEIDDLIEQTPAETKAWLKRQIRTRGIRAAYKALVAVCEDPKSPAPAKATAAGFLFRAGGVLERAEDTDAKDPSQMTPAELQEEYDRLTREAEEARREQREARRRPGPRQPSVFD